MFVAVDLEPGICSIHIGSMMFQWATPRKINIERKSWWFLEVICSPFLVLGGLFRFQEPVISTDDDATADLN